ncbi:MAG: hypothetical protein HKP52_02915, partial [Desulfofustis sp.]|nr:hypothetical protein [Desulfofustis sp.]
MNDEVQMEEGVVSVVEDQVDNEFAELQKKYDGLKSKVGTLANERAELLRLNNELLQQQSPPSEDWDYDPAEKKAEQALNKVNRLELDSQKRDLARDFPGYQEDIQSDAFQNWLAESNYRQKRFTAANGYDFDAARELLTEWSEKKSLATEAQNQRETNRRTALNSASMEKGSAGGTGKKVWDRDWLV